MLSIKGIGIDMVHIDEIERLLNVTDGAFLKRTFSNREIAQADIHPNKVEYLAARFAVKEAVFKAISNLNSSVTFDFRVVETLNDDNGCPRICNEGVLAEVMKDLGIDQILVSITTENNFAIAVALI